MIKLTRKELNAKNFCDLVNMRTEEDPTFRKAFAIQWRPSRTWGHNPVIYHHDAECVSVSGCGYDKRSTALASLLRFLYPVGSCEYSAIYNTAGTGLNSMRNALAELGWALEHVLDEIRLDVFVLSRSNTWIRKEKARRTREAKAKDATKP